VPVTSRALVEFVLLGPTNDRRQLQDSPILGDVWIAFATRPGAPQDLLISPYKTRSAGPVAALVAKRVREFKPKTALSRAANQAAHVAYLQGIVAARLFFREVLELVVPMTGWWKDRHVEEALSEYDTATVKARLNAILKWANARHPDDQDRLAREFATFATLDRYVALAGLILWAGTRTRKRGAVQGVAEAIATIKSPDPILETLGELFDGVRRGPRVDEPQVWQISLNRPALPALEKSVPAVKGDAARTLFRVKCDEIAWAVIDSGIDGAHDVFKDAKGKPRIVRSFDFSNIRSIVNLDNRDPKASGLSKRIHDLLNGRPLKAPPTESEAVGMLTVLARDAEDDRPINWTLVERLVEIEPTTPPPSSHGTHVAGIIGGNGGDQTGFRDGMCPDITLYDFRVLGAGPTLEDTEFAIIAALQYIRHLNDSRSFITIHGVNLSLSIPHDVRNFACGRTPICNECERLVESGVVVVAAAGNLGYHTFETKDGAYEGYTAFSITDPGNADSVITVGATHRSWPHTYGVSFFSSRGPTGDGRMKPDLVAPGERIHSSMPGNEWKELDGTSMAAPHVSGAAAMLMARYAELVGQPRRVKSLLCDSATDLGRERSFQGHGMLDVLRAFQNV
jgi:serine protease AprX